MKDSESELVDPASQAQAARIILAARRRFFLTGFRGVTMDELAADLGMSKKTLYAHFPSKRSLVESLFLDKFRRVEADLDQCAANQPGTAGLAAMLTCIRRHTEEIQPVFMQDLNKELPDAFDKVVLHRRELIQKRFGSVLTQGQCDGTVRADIPVHLMLEILVGAVDAVANPRKLIDLNLSLETAISRIMDVFLKGVTTEKGRANL
jgi:TetR/AcrR family transcriptional regulator, cholesterol catabolism regulator